MMTSPATPRGHEPSPTQKSVRRYLVGGAALVMITIGGLGGWAATTEISGAIVASGKVAVENNVKKVQHPSGGVVAEIHARNDDRVEAGDVLLRLDNTIAKANLTIINKRLIELRLRVARLKAERDVRKTVTFSRAVASDPTAAYAMAAERRLFALRRAARDGQKAQLAERIAQLGAQVRGLTAQAAAKAEEITLIQRELVSARHLWKKQLTSISKITALEREATRLKGQHAQLLTSASAARGRMAEIRLQVIQVDRDLGSQVADQLRELEARVDELTERKVAAQDQLERVVLRAPQSGTVHQSTVHTVGGVINGGEPVMLIVPDTGPLTVAARIAPENIDQVRPGQPVILRFTAFNMRTTPEVDGTLHAVSADSSTDAQTGASYYTARIALPASAIRRLGDRKLLPGMPVEVFVKTEDRNVLSYLMKPLSDQSVRAFREE